MNNMVVLYKTEDGDLYCQQLSEEGIRYMKEDSETDEDNGYWDDGGTIVLEELEEILDRQV
jgi:hypothetical protein